MGNKFTNVDETFAQDPNEWNYVNAEKPTPSARPGEDKADFAPGATEPTTAGGALESGGYEAAEPPDPRLGMNPQGSWTADKIRKMFPGMLPDATANLLDPAEQAKKERGLPYDANKKFVSDPDWEPDTHLQIPMRPNREQFEQILFKQIGGNPFTYNPYEEVEKQNGQLEQLFNSYFGGKISWADRGRLSKDEAAAWDRVRKEFRARGLQKAQAQQKNMMLQYKDMMGQFASDNKAMLAENLRVQKERAKSEAAGGTGKAPSTKELLDENGDTRLYVWDPEKKDYVATKHRTKFGSLKDNMPNSIQAAKVVVDQVLASMKEEDKNMLIGMMKDNPTAAAQLLDSHTNKLPPEIAQLAPQAMKTYFGWIGQQMAPPKAAGAAAEKPVDMRPVISTIAQAVKAGDPRAMERVAKFKEVYPQYGPQLDALLKKLGITPPAAVRAPGAAQPAANVPPGMQVDLETQTSPEEAQYGATMGQFGLGQGPSVTPGGPRLPSLKDAKVYGPSPLI